jgi:class 3 adenylate cyclase
VSVSPVGRNSGQVIAVEIGSGALGYTAIGEQFGIAQRMESVPPPDGQRPVACCMSVVVRKGAVV